MEYYYCYCYYVRFGLSCVKWLSIRLGLELKPRGYTSGDLRKETVHDRLNISELLQLFAQVIADLRCHSPRGVFSVGNKMRGTKKKRKKEKKREEKREKKRGKKREKSFSLLKSPPSHIYQFQQTKRLRNAILRNRGRRCLHRSPCDGRKRVESIILTVPRKNTKRNIKISFFLKLFSSYLHIKYKERSNRRECKFEFRKHRSRPSMG